jgi:transcriptional regulator with GAF, ATPase, and Fis domain
MATGTPASLFSDPKQLLLDMAKVRSLADLLDLIVRRIAESPVVCLARLWLVRPGGPCDLCPMRADCPDQTACLHLVASAGKSLSDPSADYSRINGAFRRFPIGVRKVGRIAQTGEALEAPDLAAAPSWIAKPEWILAEGIHGFGGQPLIHQGQVLGVLAVCTRAPLQAVCLDWLRMVANHAAAAIANARAWDDIQALRKQLELERDFLQEEALQAVAFGDMIGESAALQSVARQIELVAQTDSSVLILGETGTGKELVAREIHRRSRRAQRLLVTVNCAAVPRELFESEFFGHAKGAFTGALRERVGRFELANGGTLFLDEIGEIPLDLQSKLLRVLQEGELERIGEERTRKTDVRLIAATNRNLRDESDAGRFRTDLYYRLSVFPIELAPLRRRKEDIPLLAAHFVEQIARRLGRPAPRLTLANIQRLQQHDWPGNIRELQHVLERALINSSGERLIIDPPTRANAKSNSTSIAEARSTQPVLTHAEMRKLEVDNIRAALELSRGRVYGAGGAAELLQMKPTTLTSRLKVLGIR